MSHILIVDDERGSRESLKAVFEGAYQVSCAAGADEAAGILSRQPVDLLLLDVIMPEKDGIAFLREAHARYPRLPVIMISASSSVRSVVEAIQEGAFDFLTKPFDVEEVRRLARRAIDGNSLSRHVENLKEQIEEEFPVHGIVGRSAGFQQALADARKAAATDANVLITGESGTGKELVARLVHALSNRVAEPFVPVHCGALPESLMESELFGHEKGAFTNADRQKLGRFDLAGSGTLFFDEVSEMSPATQVKLLRVLQEREFMRVGGTRVIPTNARILTATNVDLRQAVNAGVFRRDLYYRLSVVPIQLPPLRQRLEDIPVLARHFLTQFRADLPCRIRDFTAPAIEMLCAHNWPGNVRELRNLVERMLVLYGREKYVLPEHLPEEFQQLNGNRAAPDPAAAGVNLADAVNDFERRLVQDALRQANGVQTRAAEILGTTRRILKYRMEKLNISG
jgi:DNA-binding NtrC family response regulator